MNNIKYMFMIIPATSIHFCSRPDRPWGPLSLLHNLQHVSFPGVKRPGCGVGHPPPSSAEVRGRLELYSPALSGPAWPDIGWKLPLPLPYPHLSVVIATESKPWVYVRLLAARVRIPLGTSMFVLNVVCCRVRGLCVVLILYRGESHSVWVCPWAWSGATVKLYYNEQVEEVRQKWRMAELSNGFKWNSVEMLLN